MADDYSTVKGETAFYFMPDISGFSNFVENTAIEHSVHIISELLEVLLDNNVLQMKLAEIEGDALFLYTQKAINLKDMENQVKMMLDAFRKHLLLYENQRICDCGACSTAINLKLKFISHFGRLDFIEVKKIKKPYGKDVNKIHRLLKNRIPLNEYFLLTEPTIRFMGMKDNRNSFNKSKDNYDIGEQNLPIDGQNAVRIHEERKAEITIEKEVSMPIEELYELVSNFKYRKLWDKSLTEINFKKNAVNQAGSRHSCIIGSRKMNFETLHKGRFKADKTYAEKTKNMPMVKEYQFYILLDRIGDSLTSVKVINYLESNWLGKIMKKKVYKKIKNNWNNKLEQLEKLGKEKPTIIND